MAVMVECSDCGRRQALKSLHNKQCLKCPSKLTGSSVSFWVHYRLGSKQHWDGPHASIGDARAADGRIRFDKRRGKLTSKLETAWTVASLVDWYLDIESVKQLKSYRRVCGALANVKIRLGSKKLTHLGLVALKDYQIGRERDGAAPATIDMELTIFKTAVTMAFYDGRISGQAVRAFGNLKKKLKKGGNARKKYALTIEQLVTLVDNAPDHFRPILSTEIYTGMRAGELRGLTWEMVDLKTGFFRLPAELCKEGHRKGSSYVKLIPIAPAVRRELTAIREANLMAGIRPVHVFLTDRSEAYRYSFRHAMGSAVEGAGLLYGRKEGGYTFHDLRGTVKTLMLRAGVEGVYRDAILGHSLQGMDVHYLDNQDEGELAAAMKKYAAWLDAETEDVKKNVKNPTSMPSINSITS